MSQKIMDSIPCLQKKYASSEWNEFKYIIYNCLMKLLILIGIITLANSYTLCSNSSAQCFPCPSQCASCTSQSQCSACDNQYYYTINATSNCNACPQNCLTCSSSSACLTCMNPYVLSNQTCSLCVIKYAISCSTTVSASVCQSGYYLSDNYCYNCLLNCITCSSAYDCSACASGYYLNTSIITCNPCPQGCSACNQYTPTQCTSCISGYQYSANSCTYVACSIANCLYCSNSSSCYQCQQMYYWNGNSCVMGASVTCQLGALGPLPPDCINSCSSFTFLVGNSSTKFECKIYSSVYVSLVEYHQIYYYAYNHQQQLNKIANANASLVLQSSGEYSYPLLGTLPFSSIPNYYRLQIAIKYTSQNVVLLTLSASTPTTAQNEMHSLAASSTPTGLIINSSVVHSYNLNFTTNDTIGIVEIRLRLWKCSSGCTICLNQQLCQLCNAPNFMLSYNCVANCSVYIHFLANRTCLTSCPYSYYEIVSNGLKYCQSCSSPCSACTNSTFCLSCLTGFYYYSYSCLSTCPTGYYAENSTNTCISCISPCKTCTSLANCLSCSQGFWNGSSCSNSCPSGKYGDEVNYICANCDSSCLTCINTAVTCTSCLSSLIFYNKQCLYSCPSRYYNNSGTCTACVPPCYTCTSATACLSCSYNYLLNSSCISTCPIGYYRNLASLVCSACLSSCKTCTSGTSCTSCKSGCLYSGNCPSSCPNQQYFSQISNSSECSCIQCIYPCNTCTNQYTCLTCLEGYYYNGSCLIQCPDNYYANSQNDTCSLCSQTFSNCLTCLSSYCTQCSSNYYLLTGVCLSSCPMYYFSQNQQCLFCVAPCQTCISTDSCTSCITPYVLSGTACLIQCPSSMIAMSVNGSLICKACTLPCLSCFVVQNNCTYCMYGYYLYNFTCVSNCSLVTPTYSYYSQLATLTCQTCAFPCSKCLTETWCVTCKIGYLNQITGTCSQCSLGTYALNSSCFSCPSSCKICYSATFCTSCANGYYLLNNTCISNASICAVNGYYITGNVCYPCLQPCSTCWITSNNCTTCLQGYIFFSPNNCKVDCPAKYFNHNQTCSQCATQCATCISTSTYCLTCSNGYFLYITNSSCLTSCPASTYLSGSSCSSCQYPCLTCTSQVQCLTCVSGVLIGTQCYTSCLSGYFANSSLMCQACSSPCQQCTSVSTNCTQCLSNYWLLNNTCISACPSVYFSESQSGQCLKCVGLCLYCTSYVNCTACISGYILFYSVNNLIGQCITECPATYYLKNGSCISCPTQCNTCSNGSACITCLGNLVQYLGQCLSACPNGMYSLGGICQTCSFPCQNCTDAYTCTSCPSNYLLVGSSSCIPGPKCPSGFYLQSNNINCDSKCASGSYNLLNSTCSNFSCGSQAFMGADSYCYLTCPQGYVANQSLHCVYCNNCNEGLLFTISTQIIRDQLYLYLIFTETPYYSLSPSISLSPSLPFQSMNFEGNLVGGSINYTGTQNITFLLPVNTSVVATPLNLSFNLPIETFRNPLQKSYSIVQFAGFDYYPTSMPSLTSLGVLALICALMGLIKNPYMTDFSQILFLLGLLDTHYPSHLASFLEGSSLAHFHGLIPLQQDGCLGTGKFMYLTGTGFLSNTFTNWIIIVIVLAVAGILSVILWIRRKKLSYSRVHQEHNQQTLSEENREVVNTSGCIGLLQKLMSNFKYHWLNRLIYFNYSIISLFALTQLANFQISTTINLLSCALALIVIPCIVVYPLSLRYDKPKYTFLYMRKLLISGAVVLSTQDSIYAVGIISVCNVATALLMLTHKIDKYRWETRFLATGEMLQLFTLVCLSFFIMIGEGNQTENKVTLCWIIIGSAVSILVIYILHACFEVFILIYNWAKNTEIRQGWTLNKQQEQIESHHSQSVTQSVKDAKEKEVSPSNQNMETLLVQPKENMKDEIIHMPLTHPKRGTKTNQNGDFWVYEQSQKSNEDEKANNTLPQLLVRCVNEFSDYNSDKQQ